MEVDDLFGDTTALGEHTLPNASLQLPLNDTAMMSMFSLQVNGLATHLEDLKTSSCRQCVG